MIEVPRCEELSKFDLRSFKVPPLEKYIEHRGYMYIVFNSLYPKHIKIGRTADAFKRLQQYNSDAPFPTAKMLYISKMFNNVVEIERQILDYLYSCTSPTTLSKEWFEIEHMQKMIDIIEKAEKLESNAH